MILCKFRRRSIFSVLFILRRRDILSQNGIIKEIYLFRKQFFLSGKYQRYPFSSLNILGIMQSYTPLNFSFIPSLISFSPWSLSQKWVFLKKEDKLFHPLNYFNLVFFFCVYFFPWEESFLDDSLNKQWTH